MKIALALSGGGHRAAAFHLGVLKYLAEKSLLENVTDLSTTSGGSILVAQIFHNSAAIQSSLDSPSSVLAWPDSNEFLAKVLPLCKVQITQHSLENDFIKRMLVPANWLKIGHRANLMARVLKKRWLITGPVQGLPKYPNWIINGTTNLSGARWRVEHVGNINVMGSDDTGFTNSSRFAIADAVAISAAYPGVIGPYRFKTGDYDVYLSDGGLYDNLGLEPVFDLESQQIREGLDADFLIVSDASKGITHKRLAPFWRPLLRTLRLIDVINQQVRSLRLRTLLPFLKQNPQRGAYLAIGSIPQASANLPDSLMGYEFLSEVDIELAKNTRTSLASLSEAEFDNLVRHGYETALIQFSQLTSRQRITA